jgi:hypothetical protein
MEVSIEEDLSIKPEDRPVAVDLNERKADYQKKEDRNSALRKLGYTGTAVGTALFTGGTLAVMNGNPEGILITLQGTLIGTPSAVGTEISRRKSIPRQQDIEHIQEDLRDTYVFDSDVDFSEFLSQSEELNFEDTYFADREIVTVDNPEETEDLGDDEFIDSGNYHSLYEFNGDEKLGFYKALLGESGDIDQFLTVSETGEGHEYILDIGIDNKLAGRFVGYTEEDIDQYLEEGEPGDEVSRFW